jgi:hypothetical protein
LYSPSLLSLRERIEVRANEAKITLTLSLSRKRARELLEGCQGEVAV